MITLASFVKVSLIRMSATGKVFLCVRDFSEFVNLKGNHHVDKNKVR